MLTKSRNNAATDKHGNRAGDRVSVRLGDWKPLVDELAAKDGRKTGAWIRWQIAKIVRKRLGINPERASSGGTPTI